MSLTLQISARDPLSGKEREPQGGWTELPKLPTGEYDTTLPVWRTEPSGFYSQVSLRLETDSDRQIVSVISDGEAEVNVENIPLVKKDYLIQLRNGLVLKPATIVDWTNHGEVFFDKPGQEVILSILYFKQVVKEVKINSVAGE